MTLTSLALLASVALSSLSPKAPATIYNRRIERDETVAHALRKVPLAEAQVEQIISALEGVFDFRRSRVGDQFQVVLRSGELDLFDYRQSTLDEWQVRRDGERYVGIKRGIEVEKQVAMVTLDIESSLYEAAIAAGEDPAIAMTVSDVFAWDIDFYNDVRKGDRVRAVVERFVSKGRVLRYGEVLAAGYDGETVGRKRVYRYQLPDETYSYFQEDGASARKTFLKSPLKYAHVTSRFGNRFHPVLRYLKAHNGVDYGASIGTPVWSVADGTVTQAGYDGASGKKVCVRHMNSFETCYLHLSAFGAGVTAGARVKQKQVIAYTGNTGRSTGPHLHFALKRGGQYVNPLNQSFPRADPLPRALAADFSEKIASLRGSLEGLEVATAAQNNGPTPIQ